MNTTHGLTSLTKTRAALVRFATVKVTSKPPHANLSAEHEQIMARHTPRHARPALPVAETVAKNRDFWQ
jgi:hypothetical protein